jgi:hypothetical protein
VKRFLIIAAGAVALSACASRPTVGQTQSKTRTTLDRQVPGQELAEVDSKAQAAQAALSKLKGEQADELSHILRQAHAEIRLAYAEGQGSEIAFLQAMESFNVGTSILSKGGEQVAEEELVRAAELLDNARDQANDARGTVPSAVSPSNALEILRKQQTDDGHYNY